MSLLSETTCFLKKKSFIFPLVLILVLSFGFGVTHIAQGVDDLCRVRYVENGFYIGFNRLFGWVAMCLLGPTGYETPLQAIIGVLFLGFGAVLSCVLFRRASRDQIPDICYTIFACLFVSCPFNMAIWVYGDTGFMVKVSYCLIPLALLLLDHFFNDLRLKYILLPTILLMVCISMFESAAAVFVFYVGAYLTLREFYHNHYVEIGNNQFPNLLYRGLICAGILLIAILLKSLLTSATIHIFSIQETNQLTQRSSWLSDDLTIIQLLTRAMEDIISYYAIAGLFYLPLGLILLGWLICIPLLLFAVLKRRPWCLLSIFIIGFSPVLIMLIQGNFSCYRTCQSAAPFIAFMLTVPVCAVCSIKGSKWPAAAVTALLLCFSLLQSYAMDQLFRADFARYQAEAAIAEDIYTQLSSTSAFFGKPTCFINTDRSSPLSQSDENIRAFQPRFLGLIYVDCETKLYDKLHGRINFLPNSIFMQEVAMPSWGWAVNSFGDRDTEFHRFLVYEGLDGLTPASHDIHDAAQKVAGNYPTYPNPGYIQELEDCIIVNLG